MALKQLSPDDFEPVQYIGSGTYSTITLEKYKKTGELIALKTFTLVDEDERYESDFMKEIAILGTFHHPCIIKFHGFLSEERNGNLQLSYALDYMEKGCLDGILTDINNGMIFPNFGMTERSIIILGVACAMRYMHHYAIQNGSVLHRDLKSGNILLDKDYKPKLADFGFAKVIQNTEYNTPKRGSWPWMAPEVMDSSHYGLKSDVYSFGMLIYEILTAKVPFDHYSTALEICNAVLKKKERPVLPEPRLKIYELIEQCWDQDPVKRPDFNDIVPLLLTETYLLPETDPKKYFQFATEINASYPEVV